MITIAIETQFGLVDLHQRGLEGITIVDRKEEVLYSIIPLSMGLHSVTSL
jgi:hypothetical protein